jgi:hypothetical protein
LAITDPEVTCTPHTGHVLVSWCPSSKCNTITNNN